MTAQQRILMCLALGLLLAAAFGMGLPSALAALPPVEGQASQPNAPAAPPAPQRFHGSASLYGGVSPLAGRIVTAWVTDVVIAETRTTLSPDGRSMAYDITVPGDDPATPGREGPSEGMTVTLKIEGNSATTSPAWHAGGDSQVNLEVAGGDACVFAFNDLNGNGKRDTGEGPLVGATIELKSSPSVVARRWIQTPQTMPHCFRDLSVGLYYTINLIPPSGFVRTTQTADNSGRPVGVIPQPPASPGGTATLFETGAQFLLTYTPTSPPQDTATPTLTPTPSPTPTITPTPTLTPTPLPVGVCVRVYRDMSGNGGFDVGVDPLLAGAKISINQLDVTTPYTTTWVTDATEIHCDSDLPTGHYEIKVEPSQPPTGTWHSTTGRTRQVEVALNTRYLLDFGEQLLNITYTPTFTPLPSEPTETSTPTPTPTATGGSPTATRTPRPTPTFSPDGRGLCVLACNDLNQNNKCDAGERALTGYQIQIRADDAPFFSPVASHTFTDETEPYCWPSSVGINNGFYHIYAPPPPQSGGWRAYYAAPATELIGGTPTPAFDAGGNNYYKIYVTSGRAAYFAAYIAPSPTPTATDTATLTPTPSTTPTITLTPSPSATATETSTATPTSTDTPPPTASATASSTAPASVTATVTLTATVSPTPSATLTPSPTSSPTPPPTATSTATATATASRTATPSATASGTATPTLTPGPTGTATPTATPSWTATASATPTVSTTPTVSPTGTQTTTPEPTATVVVLDGPVGTLGVPALRGDQIIVVRPTSGSCDDLAALLRDGFWLGTSATRYNVEGSVARLENGWCLVTITPTAEQDTAIDTAVYNHPPMTTTPTLTLAPAATPTSTLTPSPTLDNSINRPYPVYLPYLVVGGAVPTKPHGLAAVAALDTLAPPKGGGGALLTRLMTWLTSAFEPRLAEAAPPAQATVPSAGKVRVLVQNPTVLQGAQFTINVYAQDVLDVYSAGFTLTFDASRLAVEDADPGTPGIQVGPGPFPAAPRVTLANTVDNNNGLVTYRVSVVPPGLPDNGDGAIAAITFRALAPGGVTFSLSNVSLTNQAGATIGVATENGSITVLAPTVTPSPTVPTVRIPRIRLLPAATQVGLDQTVTLDAYLEDVSDVQAITVTISFNAALVSVEDSDMSTAGAQITPGTFPDPDRGTVENRVDNAAGLITYGVRLNPGQPPAEGSGRLAAITFKGKALGTTPVRYSSIVVRTGAGGTLNVTSYQASITVTTPPTTTPTPTATPERTRKLYVPLLIRAAFPDVARVVIVPRDTSVVVGQNFAVDLNIERVIGLFGAEVVLSFDPTVIQVVDAIPTQNGIQIVPGDFPDAAQGFVARNQVDNALGRIHYSVTLLAPSVPVSGSGRLATILLRARQVGETSLKFETTRFASAAAESIASFGQDGSVEVVPQPTATPTITRTPTQTLTATITPSPTPSLTVTRTPSPTVTLTPTIGPSPTRTDTPTPSLTPTVTQTRPPTLTPTITLTPLPTRTRTVTPTPTLTYTPGPTRTPTATFTPSPTRTPGAACVDVVQNGGFEIGGAEQGDAPPWAFPNRNARRSNFRPAHSGDWYAFLGVPTTLADDHPTFTSAWQVVDVPADARELRLTYWYWPGSQDNNVDLDQQMAIIYKGNIADGYPVNLGVLMREDRNAGGWEERSFDLLTALREDVRGQKLTIYFTVYNNGNGARTWMYLDDVSLLACR